MDINQTVIRDNGCDLVSVTLADLRALGAVDAVHDLRLRIGEALAQCPCEEQVFGRTRAAALSEQAIDGAVARAAVWQRSHGLDEVDQWRVCF